MTHQTAVPPFVRVEDASMVADGGPARLVLCGVPRASEIADAVAAARGVSWWVGERLVVTAAPDRLVDAAGRVGGAELADLLRAAVDQALHGWLGAPPDLHALDGMLPTSQRPHVMAVLNVTPDSFSDGGQHHDDGHPRTAIEAGLAMVEAGADLVDVGGESTRPGATAVPVDEELARVVPVVEGLVAAGVTVAVDTTKAAVARAAVEAGAVLVNDVSAGRFDEDLLPTVAALGAGYVLMHMQGTPATMQDRPAYADVVAEVTDFLAAGLHQLEQAGVSRERVALDPGFGFGKALEHNVALLARIRELTSFGRPVVVGASRKAMIGSLTGVDEPALRVGGSVAAAALAVAQGAAIVRAHDVEATAQAVRVAHAVGQV